MIDEEAILEEAQTEVEEMSQEELEAEARKLLEQRAKRRSYQQKKTPEQLEKQKAYRQKKYQRDKLLLEKVKSLPNYEDLEKEAEEAAELEE